jgi:AraC-like DNA-binding protein
LLPSPGQITLSGNPIFQKADSDKAGRRLSPYLCQHTVSTRHDKDLSFKHWHWDVGDVGIHLLRYGVKLTISGVPGNDCYTLLMAREELLRADPCSHNVTTITMDCGFTHLSQFASLFKPQIGECPSDALKRPGRS